jgi:hypothetical protein
MAKLMVLRLAGEASSFAFARLDREKLYGRKERQVVDAEGRACYPAWLSSDGAALVPSGGLAMLYVDEGFATVERSALRAVDEQGAELPLQPSTLGVPQDLEGPVAPQRVLAHVISSVYQLQAENLGANLAAELDAGKIFCAPFNFRDDYALEVLFLVRNEAGTFGLVGKPSGFEFVRRELLPAMPAAEEGDDLADDLDFNML